MSTFVKPAWNALAAGRALKLTRGSRELLWVTFGQVIAMAGSFVGIKLLTNTLGPEIYGQLALGLSIAGLLSLFVYGPISQWVLRFFSIYLERNELAPYLAVTRKIYVRATLGVIGLAVLALPFLASVISKQWVLLALFAVLFAIVAGANTLYVALQSAARERKVVALHQGADAWLKPLFAAFAVTQFSRSGHVALLGFFIGTLVVSVSQALLARRSAWMARSGKRRSLHVQREPVWLEFRAYAAPFVLYALFGTVSLYADRWILLGAFGEREVGIYTAMYQLASAPILLLSSVMGQLMAPVIFDRAGSMTTEAQVRSSGEVVSATVIAAGVVMAVLTGLAYYFGEAVITAFTSPEFTQFHGVFWILVLALSLFNIAQLLSFRGFSSRQTGLYVWPKGVQALSFAVLSLLLVRQYGLYGVAVALAISSLAYLAHVIIQNRRVKVRSA